MPETVIRDPDRTIVVVTPVIFDAASICATTGRATKPNVMAKETTVRFRPLKSFLRSIVRFLRICCDCQPRVRSHYGMLRAGQRTPAPEHVMNSTTVPADTHESWPRTSLSFQ